MAHLTKYAKVSCGHLSKHYERATDLNGEYIKFGNENIDTTKTQLNYNLGPNRDISQIDFINQRCSEIKCLPRKDVNVMCSWVVTAPKNLAKDQEREFFSQSYKFLEDRYGKENVISSYVHMDEITPHMHYSFVPVVYDKKKDILKVSAKELLTRKDLQTFHKDLSAHMEKHFGYDIGILNEATKEGNKSINELKRQSATERLNEANKNASKIVSKAQEHASSIKASLEPLNAEYEAKKAFIDQSVKDSDVSMMYPDYVKLTKKGLFSKQEYVTVPKEMWEKKHVSANQIQALKQERQVLEKSIDSIKNSEPVKKVLSLQSEVKELKQENLKLTKGIENLKQESKAILEVLQKHNLLPEVKELLESMKAPEKLAIKAIKKTFDLER